jgi:dynein heavy chain
MVYMEPQSLGLQPLIDSWMNTLPAKVGANKYITTTLEELWKDMLDDALYLLRRNLPEMVFTVDNNITQSCMRLLDCYL